MNKNKKQHIVPKSYLKHFSINGDGKSLHVINLHKYQTDQIKIYDSGSKAFKELNYYDSLQFRNKKTIEISLSRLSENQYHRIVESIKEEKPIKDKSIKDELLMFIFITYYRSPARRLEYEQKLRFKKFFDTLNPSKSEEQKEKIDDALFVKELHLSEFANEQKLYKNVDDICTYLGIKKWEILIVPNGETWLTSDDPCTEIKIKEDSKLLASKEFNFKNLDAMFIPITQKYCLLISPYGQDDDISKNLNTEPISFKNVTQQTVQLFNRFSFATMNKLLIGESDTPFLKLGLQIKIIEEELNMK